MGAVTYSNDEVAGILNQEVVPVQLPYDAKPQSRDYNVKWTPALFVIDGGGLEHHSSVGFLPPEEFVPFLILGMGKAYFDKEQLEDAIGQLQRVIDGYPDSMAAPEAVYLRGVCRYKTAHSVDGLVDAYELLQANYPSSEWARRAEPYRLLKNVT